MQQTPLETKITVRQCDLIVTEKCSLACRMCHIWQHSSKKQDELVSPEEYKDFMSSLKEFAGEGVQIQFVGGEPLMKKGLVDLIRFASEQHFPTTMTTNGFLLDKELAGRIVDSGLNTLGFSLESFKADTHDFLRGRPGVHKKVMEALSYFGASPKFSPQIFIAAIIAGANLDDIVGLAEWANACERISFIYFQAVMQPFAMPEADAWYDDERCRFLWPDADKAAGVLEELIARKKSGYKINNSVAQLEIFKSYFRQPQRFIKKTKCNLGYDAFTVLPDGNMFLCLAMEPIGNIKTDTMREVWFSEKACAIRERIANCKRNCKLMVNCFFEEETNG